MNLSLLYPEIHPEDLSFIENFLKLEPSRRMHARDALKLPYLTREAPLPCSLSDFSIYLKNLLVKNKKEVKKKVTNYSDYLV